VQLTVTYLLLDHFAELAGHGHIVLRADSTEPFEQIRLYPERVTVRVIHDEPPVDSIHHHTQVDNRCEVDRLNALNLRKTQLQMDLTPVTTDARMKKRGRRET
jgi:hypothetical protein